MSSEAAADQGWFRKTAERREESERERLLRLSPRHCALCNRWTDHHTDSHPSDDDELVDESEAHEWAKKCRQTISEKQAQ